MADTPQYTKGDGPDQLPQGGATQLNDAVAAIPKPQRQPVQPSPQQHGPVPLTGDDALLFGPPSGKEAQGSALTAGVGPASVTQAPPNLGAVLPDLIEAARDPDAPPALKALLQLVMYHAGG